jgi:hypothetical protein
MIYKPEKRKEKATSNMLSSWGRKKITSFNEKGIKKTNLLLVEASKEEVKSLFKVIAR